MRKCESPQETVRMTTLACIVLHNICIERGDTSSKKLDLSIDAATNGRRNRDVIHRQLEQTVKEFVTTLAKLLVFEMLFPKCFGRKSKT